MCLRRQMPILAVVVFLARPSCLDHRIAYGDDAADDGYFPDDKDSDGGEDESADEPPVPYYCVSRLPASTTLENTQLQRRMQAV